MAAAEQAGLRPCKKCQPNVTGRPLAIIDTVQSLCRYIETHSHETIDLAQLEKKSGYSAAHIRKAFIAAIGCSPKAYQAGLRQQKLKVSLKNAPTLSDAIYDSGYGSSSRVYEKLDQTLGMTPHQYRKDGDNITIHYTAAMTRLGHTMIAATARGICFLQFADEATFLLSTLEKEFPKATLEPMPLSGQPMFKQWIAALNNYLDSKKSLNTLSLDIRGTAFQILVWRYLQTIPSGTTQSYTDVAKAIAKPKAVRAVARACATNPIAIAIPCHRVLRGDGQLAGYRWGMKRKQQLLDHERRA